MKTRRRLHLSAPTDSTYVALLSIAVLFGKLILIMQLERGIWIDGDGLRRFTELTDMSAFGFLVPGIDTDAAGYPTLLHSVSLLIGTDLLWPIALLQSVLFAAAVWYLAAGLQRTRVAWATIPFAWLTLCNPPLTLSTLALSGDSVTASLLMFAVGMLVRDIARPRDVRGYRPILVAAAWLGLAAVLTPIVAAGGIAMLLSWAGARGNREQAIWISAGAVSLLLALPLLLLVRNQIANNAVVVGIADRGIVAGASGFAAGDGTRCGVATLDVVSLDVPTMRCLMDWYQEASANTVDAAVPNAVAFWSPWAGPMSGTQLRDNPWRALQPGNLLSNPKDLESLIRSPIATFFSWLWLIGAVASMFVGLLALRSLGLLEIELSVAAGWLIVGTWAASTLTSADASSRLPISGLSLLLQLIGWRFIFTRGRATSRDPFAPR